jgi:excisionase family DNA binding protein
MTKSKKTPVDWREALARSPYLTSREAIAYLRLDTLRSPHSALYRLITEHKLPYGRRGGLYLFDTRELDAWVKGFGSALELHRAAGRKM